MDEYLTTSFYGSSVINVIMYIILIIILAIVIWVEVGDNMCPDGPFTTNCQPNIKNGIFTHDTQGFKSDSCAEIVEKTEKVASANINSVKWRISFILGTIIAILIWIFIVQMFPHWIILYLTVLIAFLVIYLYFNFVGFHVNNAMFSIIHDNLKILKSKCQNQPNINIKLKNN